MAATGYRLQRAGILTQAQVIEGHRRAQLSAVSAGISGEAVLLLLIVAAAVVAGPLGAGALLVWATLTVVGHDDFAGILLISGSGSEALSYTATGGSGNAGNAGNACNAAAANAAGHSVSGSGSGSGLLELVLLLVPLLLARVVGPSLSFGLCALLLTNVLISVSCWSAANSAHSPLLAVLCIELVSLTMLALGLTPSYTPGSASAAAAAVPTTTTQVQVNHAACGYTSLTSFPSYTSYTSGCCSSAAASGSTTSEFTATDTDTAVSDMADPYAGYAGTVTVTEREGTEGAVAEFYFVVQAGLSVALWLTLSLGQLECCWAVLLLKLGAGLGPWLLPSLYRSQATMGVVSASLSSYVIAWLMADRGSGCWDTTSAGCCSCYGYGVGATQHVTADYQSCTVQGVQGVQELTLTAEASSASSASAPYAYAYGACDSCDSCYSCNSNSCEPSWLGVVLLVLCACGIVQAWLSERAAPYVFLAVSSAVTVTLVGTMGAAGTEGVAIGVLLYALLVCCVLMPLVGCILANEGAAKLTTQGYGIRNQEAGSRKRACS